MREEGTVISRAGSQTRNPELKTRNYTYGGT